MFSQKASREVHDFKQNSANADANPGLFLPGDGFLLFSAQDADFRAKLWRTDGTEAGTVLLRDMFPAGFSDQAFFPLGG